MPGMSRRRCTEKQHLETTRVFLGLDQRGSESRDAEDKWYEDSHKCRKGYTHTSSEIAKNEIPLCHVVAKISLLTNQKE